MSSSPSSILEPLHAALLDLHANPYPHVPNPPSCPNRASVALIIRLDDPADSSPSSSLAAPVSTDADPVRMLNSLFSGARRTSSPKILFIRRAVRAGDRWTGHVALPGGKRDAGDASDRAAAERETREEVGLDLAGQRAVFVGNLPERVVTTSWGQVPLIVLCPFVWVLPGRGRAAAAAAALELQPTEVASAHWVPVEALLDRGARTVERVDVSSWLVRGYGGLAAVLLRIVLGRMEFSAIKLAPVESVFVAAPAEGDKTTENEAVAMPAASKSSIEDKVRSGSRDKARPEQQQQQPLLLWGLTLGIVTDLLELVPPHDALAYWAFPTFTPPDLRLVLWLLSYRFRRRKARAVEQASSAVRLRIEGADEAPDGHPGQSGIEGLGVGRYFGGEHDLGRPARVGERSSAVGILLEGYYGHVRAAIVVTLLARLAAASGTVIWLWRWWRGRSGQ